MNTQKNTKLRMAFLLMCLALFSCKTDCPRLAEIYREDRCMIIANKFPNKESSYNFEIIGKSPTTQRDTIFEEENRWFCSFYNYIDEGDTIVKRAGELVFSIHKKDTILRFQWDCEGKVYK